MSIENELGDELDKLLDEMKSEGKETMPNIDYGTQASASPSLKQRDPSELEIIASKFSSLAKELDDVYERMLHHNNTIHGNAPMEKSSMPLRGDAPEPVRSKLNLLHHLYEVLSNRVSDIRGEVNRMEQI